MPRETHPRILGEHGISQEFTYFIIIAVIIVGSLTAGVLAYKIYRAPPPAKVGVIQINDILTWEDTQKVEEALQDSSVKAVVLRINSIGGSVTASFQAESAISNLAQEKPVVAILEQYGASGAYVAASASDYIYAHDQTTTGGLGVIAIWVSYEEYFENQGIKYHVWKSGTQKDMFAPYRSPTENENAQIQELVDEYTNELFNRITANRPEAIGQLDNLRDGSVIYGGEALGYGLVDDLGSYQDAKEKAADIAGLKKGEYRVVDLSK